jgi:hypothetical protein
MVNAVVFGTHSIEKSHRHLGLLGPFATPTQEQAGYGISQQNFHWSRLNGAEIITSRLGKQNVFR